MKETISSAPIWVRIILAGVFSAPWFIFSIWSFILVERWTRFLILGFFVLIGVYFLFIGIWSFKNVIDYEKKRFVFTAFWVKIIKFESIECLEETIHGTIRINLYKKKFSLKEPQEFGYGGSKETRIPKNRKLIIKLNAVLEFRHNTADVQTSSENDI